MSGSVEINQDPRPEYQIEQISPRSYLLKFGRGGEVWARVETTGLQSTSLTLAGRNEALILTKLENIFSVAIDVNRPLTGDEIRKNFLEALSEYATRQSLPSQPTLQSTEREIKTDWILRENDIPKVMRVVAKLVHREEADPNFLLPPPQPVLPLP